MAPFFFLQRERAALEQFRSESSFDDLRLFANNYTVQGVKIRGCKAPLNRLFAHLACLDSDRLAACPFLRLHDGIYVIDMSFIPEKYRLDLDRPEQIVTNSLSKWLAAVENFGHP